MCLIGFGGYALWQKYRTTHSDKALPEAGQTVTHSTDRPDETPPDPDADYSVPANQPRKISLPGIGAEGFIQKVGLDQNKAVAVPSNIHLAGWYSPGARPGDSGVALIAGHVQGVYAPGIFKNLSKLKAGDKYDIEFGDYTTRKFEVVSVTEYDVKDAAVHMLEKRSGIDKQLNLITCSGRYDAKANQYSKRVLVVSKLDN
jgi:LPXTG-site transpeptidase (sortase) family protein